MINYGELEIVDEFGNKKGFFFVYASLSVEMYERSTPEAFITSAEVSKGKVGELKRNYEIAFISESSELLQTIR